MNTLDKSRPYATVYGEASHAFEQDGRNFKHDGTLATAGAPAALQGGAKAAVVDTSAADKATIATLEQQLAEANAKLANAGGEGGGGGDSPNLQSLGLPTKVENALTGAGILNVDALTRATEEELVALPNVGAAAIKQIKTALKKAGNRKLAG